MFICVNNGESDNPFILDFLLRYDYFDIEKLVKCFCTF